MSKKDLDYFLEKMHKNGETSLSLKNFSRLYSIFLKRGEENFFLKEEELLPLSEVLSFSEDFKENLNLLKQAVIIKLNGGLGTIMGVSGLKSELSLRKGCDFLSCIEKQSSSIGVPLAFMQSRRYPKNRIPHSFVFQQCSAPKICAKTFLPAEYPSQPSLEFYPLGHGNIYAALWENGILEKWLKEGKKFAFISNADNLGSSLCPKILTLFAESQSSFLMEIFRRSSAEMKGGHLAKRKKNGAYLLREISQCPPCSLEHFSDIRKYPFFNTNNLWVSLEALYENIKKYEGIFPLPIISNHKNINPLELNSPEVIQLETAMGAAIEIFSEAKLLEVGRERFLPVKQIQDLWRLRSDFFAFQKNGKVMPVSNAYPKIQFGGEIRHLSDLEKMGEVPSLKEAREIEILGSVSFEKGVILQGRVKIQNTQSERKVISAGTYADTNLIF